MMGCNEEVDPDCNPMAISDSDLDEFPFHFVWLDAFVIDKYEVTAGQYSACVAAGVCSYNGSTSSSTRTFNNNRENHPINLVNWQEASVYCEWLGRRLPTEAEWEKAARGTDGRIYPWGNEAATCGYAVLTNHVGEGCGEGGTWEVGLKPEGASPYGVEDMCGNLFEWVSDWYQADYYSESPVTNPQGPESGIMNTLRGGSWYNADMRLVRTTSRFRMPRSSRANIQGFRCVGRAGVSD